MMNLIKKLFLLFSFLTLLVGCAEHIVESTPSVDEKNNVDLTSTIFSEIQTNVFNKSCAFGGCHVAGDVNPDLSGNSYSNIYLVIGYGADRRN